MIERKKRSHILVGNDRFTYVIHTKAMVTQNFSDEELEGVRSARQMVEEHIAWNHHLQLLLRQKRLVQQAQQEVQQ